MRSRVMPIAQPSPRPAVLRRAVVGVVALAVSPLALLLGTAAPAQAAVTTIPFETPNNNRVVLGELASRSQRKALSVSGIGPYTIRGTDSRSGEPYEFVSDQSYPNAAQQRESDERTLSSTGSYSSNANTTYLGRSNVMSLFSDAYCTAGNTFGGLTTYCSTFGPDVYSRPFTASIGQSVSFDWAAQAASDHYEIYAYLVKVNGTGYGTPADHTLIAYGRGANQAWTTASRAIPADGTYRFRFVNGSYDATGGYALGSRMYIDNAVKLGSTNPISFAGLSDKIIGAAPFAVSATAPGGAVTYGSSTPTVCTVTGSTVTLARVGVCTITANQSGNGDYVPAETVSRSFQVLAAPTAPRNAGAPYVTGTVGAGQTVTANEGTWTDGGSPVTSTTFQWVRTTGGTSTSLPGETAATCYLVPSPGSQLTVTVTKTNAVGSTTASSTPLSGYTCAQPVAPAWPTAPALSTLEVGQPVNVTLAATGTHTPTYSVASGTLPDGLSLDPATGVVTGTPTNAGTSTYTLRATNSVGSADVVVTTTVQVGPGPLTGAPQAFVVGKPSGGSVEATGTPAPSYTVTAGTLPDGVLLDPATGEFSGTPTTAGAYEFTVTAANGVGTATSRTFTGTVTEAPGWQSTPGFAPEVGQSLDVTFTAAGTPAPTYAVTSGALPDGLVLDEVTGRVTGEPTQAGTYSFTITATNPEGSVTLTLAGTVVEGPGSITGGPGHWVVGTPTSGTVSASGTPTPSYAVTAGELPDGVALDPTTGEFTGSPSAPGPYSFTVTATNGYGSDTTRTFVGVVDQAPQWGTTDGLALQVGQQVQTQYTASGTPAPSYSVSAGALPQGLTLDPATGELAGTPTTPGPYSFTIAADNGVGSPALLVVSGVVLAAPSWTDTTIASLRVGTPVLDGVLALGTPTPTYSVTAGRLPSGLALDPTTGAVYGTPTQRGAYSFTITADNGVGTAISHEFSGTVAQDPTGGATALPPLVVGGRTSVDLSDGIDADPAPTYRVTAGRLPDGLHLDEATGMLTGTPTSPGAYSFTVTVDNGSGTTLDLEFSGQVTAAVTPDPDPVTDPDNGNGNGNGNGAGADDGTSSGHGKAVRHPATVSRHHGRDGLAFTGTNPAPLTSAGAALLILGALLLVLRHRLTARHRS